MQNTLYLSGIPSLSAGTQSPSCLHLDNRLYIFFLAKQKLYSTIAENFHNEQLFFVTSEQQNIIQVSIKCFFFKYKMAVTVFFQLCS